MPDEKSESSGFDDIAKKLEAALIGSSDEPTANGQLNELVGDVHEAIRKSRTAIVMFYHESCPFCKQLMPILEEFADEYKNKVFFGKCNVDLIEGAKSEYQIIGVPVTMAFKKGNLVARVDGFRESDKLGGWIESIFSGIRLMGLDRGLTTNL